VQRGVEVGVRKRKGRRTGGGQPGAAAEHPRGRAPCALRRCFGECHSGCRFVPLPWPWPLSCVLLCLLSLHSRCLIAPLHPLALSLLCSRTS